MPSGLPTLSVLFPIGHSKGEISKKGIPMQKLTGIPQNK